MAEIPYEKCSDMAAAGVKVDREKVPLIRKLRHRVKQVSETPNALLTDEEAADCFWASVRRKLAKAADAGESACNFVDYVPVRVAEMVKARVIQGLEDAGFTALTGDGSGWVGRYICDYDTGTWEFKGASVLVPSQFVTLGLEVCWAEELPTEVK